MMRTKSLGAALLAGVLLSGGALAQLPGGSAHWKSTIEVEGGNQPGMGPMQSENWMKQGNMRSKMQVMGMTRNMLKSGDTMYQWADGEKTGMKFNAAVQQRQGPSGDYANRIEEYRTKGKKTGSEKIDGHPCDIYELTTQGKTGRDHKETVWLATDLNNFPLKVISESNGTKVTSRNSDVEFKAAVSDAMMKPPDDVTFQDMSEMMKGMRPPKQ
jgi:outer membrane lipoprotein-sorting protein